MLISLSLHLILLMFEFLLCDRLTNGKHLWILVFIPLIVSSIVSVFFCIWAIKQADRSFEIELFLSVNALQFVCKYSHYYLNIFILIVCSNFIISVIPLKLDGFITWTWEIIFVPLWIILCLSLVMMLYSLIFCSILIRTPEMNLTQRANAISNAISNILVLPILVFQILLADKLDNNNSLPFSIICIPLVVSLFALVLLSFCSKGSCNKFWFGMRNNNFFLNMLGEYGNINISYSRNNENGVQTIDSQTIEEKNQASKKNVPIFPHFSIETPD